MSGSADAGLERVHGPRPGVRHHHQVAGFVERQVDRVERIVTHSRDLARGRRPAVDALPVRVHEVEVAGGVRRAARDVVEAARQFLHLRAARQHREGALACTAGAPPESVSQANSRWRTSSVVRLVVDRVVEGDLTVAVAVYVAKADVLRIGNLHRVGERLKRADHAVDVKVRDRDVAGAVDLERQGKAAFAALLLGLQRVDAPVGDVVHLDFVANVVLARHLVDAPLGGSVGHQHAGLCERAGRPDVEECAAAAIRDPEAGILPVPAAIEVGVGGVRVVVRILTAALDARGAVPAQEAHVVHHRSRRRPSTSRPPPWG